MQILIENSIWNGSEVLNTDECLIFSAWVGVEDKILTCIVNLNDKHSYLETVISSTLKFKSKTFEFSRENDNITLTSKVTFDAENDIESLLLDGNIFSQEDRGQWVFKFLPWSSPTEVEHLAHWSLDKDNENA